MAVRHGLMQVSSNIDTGEKGRETDWSAKEWE